jgi:hypothetical protein
MTNAVRQKMLSTIIMAHNAFIEIGNYADDKGLKSILMKSETNADRLLVLARYLESKGRK